MEKVSFPFAGRITMEGRRARRSPSPTGFDSVTIAFGIRNVVDRPRGSGRCIVLKPGEGEILEFSTPCPGRSSPLLLLFSPGAAGRRALLQVQRLQVPPTLSWSSLHGKSSALMAGAGFRIWRIMTDRRHRHRLCGRSNPPLRTITVLLLQSEVPPSPYRGQLSSQGAQALCTRHQSARPESRQPLKSHQSLAPAVLQAYPLPESGSTALPQDMDRSGHAGIAVKQVQCQGLPDFQR
jgi:hypothetical protein